MIKIPIFYQKIYGFFKKFNYIRDKGDKVTLI